MCQHIVTFCLVLTTKCCVADGPSYLLCESPQNRLIDVTASSELDERHAPSRSCLDTVYEPPLKGTGHFFLNVAVLLSTLSVIVLCSQCQQCIVVRVIRNVCGWTFSCLPCLNWSSIFKLDWGSPSKTSNEKLFSFFIVCKDDYCKRHFLSRFRLISSKLL